MRTVISIFVFGILFLTSGCSGKQQYSIAVASKQTSLNLIGNTIADVLEKTHNVKFSRDTTTIGSFDNCQRLIENKVDFALVQNLVSNEIFINSCENDNEIKLCTVIPLYEQVVFLLYKNNQGQEPSTIIDLVKNKRIGMGPKNSGTAWFMRLLFKEFGMDTTDYHPVYSTYEKNVLSDSIDVSCSFTSLNNPRVYDMLKTQDVKIFSFGAVEDLNHGSAVDAFCLKKYTTKPFVIPVNLYFSKPEKPVLTIATDVVLLCSNKIEKEIIYDFVQTIFIKKSLLVNKCNVLSYINENFDPNNLSFPLHPGVKLYLERNSPSFIERHSEFFSFLISFIVVLVSVMSVINNWNKKRKKERIIMFFEHLQNIEREIPNMKSEDEYQFAKEKLLKFRDLALNDVISKKLETYQYFTIFLSLLKKIENSLNSKSKELNY